MHAIRSALFGLMLAIGLAATPLPAAAQGDCANEAMQIGRAHV